MEWNGRVGVRKGEGISLRTGSWWELSQARQRSRREREGDAAVLLTSVGVLGCEAEGGFFFGDGWWGGDKTSKVGREGMRLGR